MADGVITRGEYNNNPGNIDFHPDIQYQGQLGIEIPRNPDERPRFARFDTPTNGIRALARLLLVYYRHHKLNTIREIISRYAPGNENDTEAYIYGVVRDFYCLTDRFLTGLELQTYSNTSLPLSDTTNLLNLVVAIIRHENGRCIYDQSTLTNGVKLALAA